MILWLLYQENAIKSYQNFWAKGLEDLYIGMNIKQSQTLWELNFVCFNLSKPKYSIKRFNVKKCYLPRDIIQNYVIVNGKNFYDQPIELDIKRYKEIKKLTTGQGEGYTTGCLLDYEYVKNHYRLIAVDLIR